MKKRNVEKANAWFIRQDITFTRQINKTDPQRIRGREDGGPAPRRRERA